MNDPKVFVLMLCVNDWGTQVVRSVLSDLRVSFRTVELNPPTGGAKDVKGFEEEIGHYLEVCPLVILVVGEARPARTRDALLRRLTPLLDAREGDRGGVSRLWLEDEKARDRKAVDSLYQKIRGEDAGAIERFLKRAVSRPPADDDRVRSAPNEDDRAFGEREGGRRQGRRAPPPAPGGTGPFNFNFDQGRSEKGIFHGGALIDVLPAASVEDESLPPPPTAEAGPAADELLCSVYSPRLAAPGDEILVQAFAHLEEQEEEVAALSAAADPSAAKVGERHLDERVLEGERLGFHLTLRGAEIDVPDQEFVWRREPLAAQFGVYFPDTSQPRDAVGTVLVTKGGVPVGHVKFTLRIVTRAEKEDAAADVAERQGDYSRYRKAFVSYASKDREHVLPRVQALAAAHIDVFQDFVELEPGERWERGLYKHIDECDAFFLFWSRAASDSQWVRKEALYAHQRREGREDRPPEIIPIIIEGPPPVAPPEELNFLHFNDKYIYLLKGVEAEAEARRNEQK